MQINLPCTMSLQPCLPLPSSCNRRRRGNKNKRKRPHHDDNDRQDDFSASPAFSSPTSSSNGNIENPLQDVSGQPISDLSQMSALEYLGLVHGEAERLGDVFVAPSAQFDGAEAAIVEEGEIIVECSDEKVASAVASASATKSMANNRSEAAEAVGLAVPKPQATKPIGGAAYAATYLLSTRTALPPPPSAAHLPSSFAGMADAGAAGAGSTSSEAWVNLTLDNFSKLRLYLESCVEGKVGSKGSGTRITSVPPMKSRVDWHVFCLGRDESVGNVGGYYQDDDDDGDGNENGIGDKFAEYCSAKQNTEEGTDTASSDAAAEAWRIDLPSSGYEPTTSLLCQMDQVMIKRVLSHHVSYLTDGYELTSNRCRWIYALLGRLAKPLHRDDAALLRELLRECCIRRSNLSLDGGNGADGGNARAKENVAFLNTMIAITGVYFEQGGGIGRLFSL